ncbi:MAG: peptidoglycan editing factor PgeF [Actinobacteria bacterium]|nr:peptidoglycan editing factor PgeF [Actinomycetota bacterium]
MNYRFTNRTGGVSTGAFASLNLGLHVGDVLEDVMRNRALVSESTGDIQFMNQVHGNRVTIIENITEPDPTADALVTGIKGITLAVQVADCIPLLLSSQEAVAAVHVGRKGLMNEVAVAALDVMRQMGAGDITAVIGPSICGTCYEVSEEMYQEVVATHPLAQGRTQKGTFALNLSQALIAQLAAESVAVINESVCTVESQVHFSYRRDGVTGRQAGIITL